VFETRDAQPEVHVSSLIVDIAKEGSFQSFAYVDAGEVLRRQLFVRGAGEYAKIGLRGVSLLKGKQHADTTLVVDHAVPHGESRELFKHIIDGEASGVYQGKVVVRQHAQKTDGGMKSQALLLSDDSAMYNKPELEIFADDVVCGHGATVGQLDEDQLFYLMARGIPRVEAEALMIEGFAREALEFVENEALREQLGQQLSAWLARRTKA
jgi:Fe-S cluster assembly protein SufD